MGRGASEVQGKEAALGGAFTAHAGRPPGLLESLAATDASTYITP